MNTKTIVSNLPSDPGPAAWNELLAPREIGAKLDNAQNFDWLIIGAGFAGLSAARRLRQLSPDDNIAVLEARTIAHGPAGRNSGFMIDLPHDLASHDYSGKLASDRWHTAQNRAAIAFAKSAAEEYAMPEEYLRTSGKINSAATAKGHANNKHFAAHLAQMNEAHELLDETQMAAITGSNYYQSGLFTPGAAMIQPAGYVRALADGLVREGVKLFEKSPVTGLERETSHWKATTPMGSISAPKVILAVNGNVESFGHFKRRLMHVYLYASMTRALNSNEVSQLGGEPNWACTPSDPLGTTVRRFKGTGGDRIIIRNRFTYAPERRVSEDKIDSIGEVHDRSFMARFPMLDQVTMEHRWGGLLCLSWNGVPAFGELETGLYSACCQNGLGTTKGTFSGMMAAELAVGEKSELLSHTLNEPSPKPLPPSLLANIAIPTYMRCREFLAGREL